MKATLSDGTILDGSFEEITTAIGALRDKFANGHKQGINADKQPNAVVWTPKRAEEFWDALYGKQKELVQFLLDKGGNSSLKEVKQHLGLTKGVQVAGLLSGITRNARRETGYKAAVVVQWTVGGDGKWRYALAREVQDLLKQILNKNNA